MLTHANAENRMLESNGITRLAADKAKQDAERLARAEAREKRNQARRESQSAHGQRIARERAMQIHSYAEQRGCEWATSRATYQQLKTIGRYREATEFDVDFPAELKSDADRVAYKNGFLKGAADYFSANRAMIEAQ